MSPGTYDVQGGLGASRPPVGSLRASDADREWAVRQLRQHLAEGRLHLDEFMERMDAAYESRTLGELEHTLVDLPHPPMWTRVHPRQPSRELYGADRRHHRAAVRPRHGPAFAPHAMMLFAVLLLTAIWPFWLVWLLLLWGAVIVFSDPGRHRHRHHWHWY